MSQSSYFLPALTAADAQTLEAAGCICALTTINHETGYIINPGDLELAIQRLNAVVDQMNSTGQFGVMRVTLLRTDVATARTKQRGTSSKDSSMEALSTVLAQVQRLQAQVNLTDTERDERLRLQAEVQSKQKDLETATQRLKSTVAIYNQTAARIRTIAEIAGALGTEMEALPAELQGQCSSVNEHLNGLAAKLTDLANSCQNDKAAALQAVEKKKSELQAAKDALVNDMSKKRVSAEEALLDAETALNDAESVAFKQQS